MFRESESIKNEWKVVRRKFPDVTFVKHLTGNVYNKIEDSGFLLHFKHFSRAFWLMFLLINFYGKKILWQEVEIILLS